MRHVLSALQFLDQDALDIIFNKADYYKDNIENGVERDLWRYRLENKILFNIFYEPSTRTRISFDIAAKNLGMQVVSTENASQFSSAIKGESLEDTIRVFCQYLPDVIVLRHPDEGSANLASKYSNVPIINAGDGAGEHPTQALLDLFTIRRHFANLNGDWMSNLTVTFGGDLLNG